jgi:hypothetical protein
VIAPARRTHLAFSPPLHRLLLPAAQLALALLVIGGVDACKVDEDEFQARIFKCDKTSPDPQQCGTDEGGNELTCFTARQIGGTDFCTKACGPDPMSLVGGECVQGGAVLMGCRPSDDDDRASFPGGACGRSDLGCLRTDVLADEGVCLTMNPCNQNTDCRDPVRSTCGAEFLRGLYKANPQITSDHLYCLQEGCDATNSACSPGETCLKKVIPAAAKPIDICVPNCDSMGRCPPNHYCLKAVSGPANPNVCIPGLLGFSCASDIGCLLGKCLSDNDETAPITLCTTTCQRDEDCTKWDSIQGHFICSSDGRCIMPDSYTGTLCRTTDDCGIRDKGTVCVRPPSPSAPKTCLRPCDPTKGPAACAARGGIGHTCLPFVDGADPSKPAWSCFPGNFGYPCFAQSQCAVPDLKCVGADLAKQQPGLCTPVCASDDDCQKSRWTGGDGYCGGSNLPFCLPLVEDGAECQDARQCRSKVCGAPAVSMSGGPAKVCGGTP